MLWVTAYHLLGCVCRQGVYCCIETALLPAPYSELPFPLVVDFTGLTPFPAVPPAPCSVLLGVHAVSLIGLGLTGALPDLSGLNSSLEVRGLCLSLLCSLSILHGS